MFLNYSLPKLKRLFLFICYIRIVVIIASYFLKKEALL